MRKLIKYLAFTAGGLVLALVILLVVLRLMYPPEALRPLVESRLAAATGRKVSLESVGFSVLRGLALDAGGVVIGEDPAFDSPFFARADHLYLKLRLWPLLRKRVEIKSLLFVRPEIYYVTNPNGQTNVGALMPKDSTRAGEGTGGKGFSLLLAAASMEEGTLHYDDRTAPPLAYTLQPFDLQLALLEKDPSTLRLSLEMMVKGFRSGTIAYASTLDRNLPLIINAGADVDTRSGRVSADRVTAGIAGLELEGSGEVLDYRTEYPEYKLELKGHVGDPGRVLGLLPAGLDSTLGLKRVEGDLNLALQLHGNPGGADSLDYRASVSLTDGKLELAGLPRPLGGIQAVLTLHNYDLLIEKFDAALGEDPVHLAGQVGLGGKTTPYDLKLGASLRLDDLPQLVPSLTDWKVGGALEADLGLRGTVESLRSLNVRGTVKGREISLDSPHLVKKIDLPRLDIQFNGSDVATVGMLILAGQSRLDLQAVLQGFSALIPAADGSLGRPLWSAKLSGPRLEIQDFVALDNSAAPAPEGGKKSFVLPLPLSYGSGSVNLDKVVMSKLFSLDSLDLAFSVRDSLLTIERFGAGLFGGRLNGSGSLALTQDGAPAFVLSIATNRVQAGRAVLPFTSFGKYLSGRIDSDFNFRGRGLDAENVTRSLTGGGGFQLSEGYVAGWPVLAGLARWSGLAELDSLPYRQWVGQLMVGDGRVSTDNMSVSSGLGDWNAQGSFGLDGSLDYNVQLALKPALGDRYRSRLPSGLAGLTGNPGEPVYLDFRLSGSPESPDFKWDTARLENRARAGIKNELGKQLNRLTEKYLPSGPDSVAADSSTRKPGAEVQDAAKQLLKGLFNKKKPDKP